LHHSSLARFRAKAILNVAQTVRGRKPQHQVIRELANHCDPDIPSQTVTKQADEQLRQRVNQALDKRLERRTKWIAEAELAPIIDPESGAIVGNKMDHRALAAHDANELRDIRTLAELGGLLNQVNTGPAVSFTVVIPGSSTPADEAQVIDVVTRNK
jgi:hypothetical protein